MIKLVNFKENNISINWGTLLIGWQGPGHFGNQLSFDDIREFAEEWLSVSDKDNDLVVDLIVDVNNDPIVVKETLRLLVKRNGIDICIEQKKWRYILIKQLVNKLDNSDDYMQGLIELTDFWSMFDFPDDSPHVVQGRGNKVSPQEYYTMGNFEKELCVHRKWLLNELVKLKTKA